MSSLLPRAARPATTRTPSTAAQPTDPRVLQGAHTDRLLTISYLPVNLAVIAAMVRLHGRISTRLRVLGGLAGFTATVATVPLVSAAAAAAAWCAGVQCTWQECHAVQRSSRA